jgi:hypothetical protein
MPSSLVPAPACQAPFWPIGTSLPWQVCQSLSRMNTARALKELAAAKQAEQGLKEEFIRNG